MKQMDAVRSEHVCASFCSACLSGPDIGGRIHASRYCSCQIADRCYLQLLEQSTSSRLAEVGCSVSVLVAMLANEKQ